MTEFLPFSKDVVFCEVMKDASLCKEIIECIINKPLKKIISNNRQETITVGIDVRSIRLDAKVETIDGKLIDIEMQVGHYCSLPLRFRGYQSILDASYWKRGDGFDKLKETYIIFLCLDDPFGIHLPIYTFEPICKQQNDLKLDFKIHWIVLNAQDSETAPKSIRHLLEYIKTNKISEDTLIQKINKKVVDINNDSKKVIAMTTIQNQIDEFRNIINKLNDDLTKEKKEHQIDITTKDKEILNLKKQIAQLQK